MLGAGLLVQMGICWPGKGFLWRTVVPKHSEEKHELADPRDQELEVGLGLLRMLTDSSLELVE